MGSLSKRSIVISIAAAGVAVAGSSAATAQTATGPVSAAAQGSGGVSAAAKVKALTVQAEAEGGGAAVGNALPADILVVVTDPTTGAPTTNLVQGNFVVINHFSHPGQSCGFSNNVVAFGNVGTGAYHLQVAPKGCNWAGGDYLLQVMVTFGTRRGQAVAKFEVS